MKEKEFDRMARSAAVWTDLETRVRNVKAFARMYGRNIRAKMRYEQRAAIKKAGEQG